MRMSILVSLGFGVHCAVCLWWFRSAATDTYPAPVLEFHLYVGIIFQCHETHFTCSFSHANISQRQQYAHQSHHSHVLMNCWIPSPLHSLADFPILFLPLTQTFTTTTIPPHISNNQTQSKKQYNNNTPRKKPNSLTPRKWPQPTSPTTTANFSPQPGTASKPSQR